MKKKIKLYAHRHHTSIQFAEIENPLNLVGFVREPIWDIEKEIETKDEPILWNNSKEPIYIQFGGKDIFGLDFRKITKEEFNKETKIKVAECEKKMWKEINDMDKPRNIALVWEKSSMTGQECWHVKCDFYGHYEGEKINFIERQV